MGWICLAWPDTHYICNRCTRDSCSCLSLHSPGRHFKGTLPRPLLSKNIVVIFTLFYIYMYIKLSTYFNMYMSVYIHANNLNYLSEFSYNEGLTLCKQFVMYAHTSEWVFPEVYAEVHMLKMEVVPNFSKHKFPKI